MIRIEGCSLHRYSFFVHENSSGNILNRESIVAVYQAVFDARMPDRNFRGPVKHYNHFSCAFAFDPLRTTSKTCSFPPEGGEQTIPKENYRWIVTVNPDCDRLPGQCKTGTLRNSCGLGGPGM
jgi:hypothetical protein